MKFTEQSRRSTNIEDRRSKASPAEKLFYAARKKAGELRKEINAAYERHYGKPTAINKRSYPNAS